MQKTRKNTFLDLEYAQDEFDEIINDFLRNVENFTRKYKPSFPRISTEVTHYFLINYLRVVKSLCYKSGDLEYILEHVMKVVNYEEMAEKK